MKAVGVGWGGGDQIASIRWFTPKCHHSLGRGQEPGLPSGSSMWVSGTQVLEP